jgi:hypothetical protein
VKKQNEPTCFQDGGGDAQTVVVYKGGVARVG